MKGKSLRIVQCFAVAVVVTALWMPVQGFAAVTYIWKMPKNVRMVQAGPDTADNVQVFTSIQAAINSITDASATNVNRVKVMPGIYNEIVTMKPFVDIEGSGQENTKITSGAVGSANNCPSLGTAVMGNNTRLENITVENTNSTNCRIAINITDKTNVIIDKVKAQTTGNYGQIDIGNFAIYAYGRPGTISINNTIAIASGTGVNAKDSGGIVFNTYGDSAADVSLDNVVAKCTASISTFCGGAAIWGPLNYKISNSSFIASGGRHAHGIDVWGDATSQIRISNTTSEANLGTIENIAIELGEGITAIDKSTFIGKGTASYGIRARNTIMEVNNSSISGETLGVFKLDSASGPFRIGASKISGGFTGLTADIDKVVNCRDQNNNPIPNL